MQFDKINQAPLAVEIDNVRKIYLLHQTPLDRLRELIGLGRPEHVMEHSALDGVSLKIKKGETVGILGINGAGKSTLLQIITGVLKPSAGTVQTHGRIAALLELGAGFNSMWSGRKNAEFQCILQGVNSADIADHLAKVEEFSDIGTYFDEPVRTYSSGMYMRVAFAAAVVSYPDILIVDEALAVGDIKFQNKCYRRFQEMQSRGCTILFVTHSPDLISQFCNRGIILRDGKIFRDGAPSEISKMYMSMTTGGKGNYINNTFKTENNVKSGDTDKEFTIDVIENRHCFNPQELRSGSGSARIVDALLHRGDYEEILGTVFPGEQLHLSVRVEVEKDIKSPETGVILRSSSNQILSGAANWMIADSLDELVACSELVQHWDFTVNFLTGTYFIDLGISDIAGGERLVHDLRQSVLGFDISTAKPVFGIVDVNFALNHKLLISLN